MFSKCSVPWVWLGYSPRRGAESIGDTLQWLEGIKILRLNTIFE